MVGGDGCGNRWNGWQGHRAAMSRRRAQRQATFQRRNPARTAQRAIPTVLPILSSNRPDKHATNHCAVATKRCPFATFRCATAMNRCGSATVHCASATNLCPMTTIRFAAAPACCAAATLCRRTATTVLIFADCMRVGCVIGRDIALRCPVAERSVRRRSSAATRRGRRSAPSLPSPRFCQPR